jgi:hypothetical protein
MGGNSEPGNIALEAPPERMMVHAILSDELNSHQY